MRRLIFSVLLSTFLSSYALAQNIGESIQSTSVTIRTRYSQGSGSIVTRRIGGRNINFVWTAAHVLDDLRRTRRVVIGGAARTVVYFRRASIVKEIVESGQRVGEIKMEAEVIRYSNADTGEDLALLRVLKSNFIQGDTKFYLKKTITPVTTELCHVGSLLGQFGANSFTSGRMSQIGRVLSNEKVFDQTTVTAFPGSSGGGVFVEKGANQGRYIGMLVRGAGETFNLIVPVRRMKVWAARVGVSFALDPSITPPSSLAKLKAFPIEDIGAIKRIVTLRGTDEKDEIKGEPKFMLGKLKKAD